MKPCKFCGNEFKPKKKSNIFCCRSCQSKWLRKNNITGRKRQGIEKICIVCKNKFYVPQYRTNTSIYCSRNCLAKIHLAQYVPIYGFKKTNTPKHEYIYIITPEGKRTREHRYIMEKHLNRKLNTFEHVHHIDGNSKNNKLENLIVLTNGEHQRLELINKSFSLTKP